MKKIKALLEKSGAKPEVSQQICESLESYKKTLREQFESEYSAKIEEAKKICIEETEIHKQKLARRVQIFCETKSAAVESALTRQSAIKESEALAKLKNIVSLVEGIEPNSKPDGGIEVELKKLKRQVKTVNEEKKLAIETANRQTALAEKILKKNRSLESAVQQNSRAQSKLEAIEESVTSSKPRRIDAKRRSGKPVTTRPTILENQDPKPVQQRTKSHVTGTTGGDFGIGNIAADMDGDLI
tara:strand:- start:655 stop:1383 length:729 start_codon:yes stop_codon:yes gene_type:complete